MDPIEVATGPPTPALPGSVTVRPDVDSLIDVVASLLLFQAKSCVRTFGDFHLALSGGSTPEPLYRRLMYDPNFRDLPWKRTHLWIVDERCVPHDHEKSNFGMIRETLVEHSDIPPGQVHAMDTSSDSGAAQYEREIQETLAWREKGHDRLDFVLLGLGADGHTASLFPNSPALEEQDRLVAFNHGPTVVPPPRITLTYRMINSARFIAVLVTGASKRPVIERIVAGNESTGDLPILGVRPLGGEMRWCLDEDACPRP